VFDNDGNLIPWMKWLTFIGGIFKERWEVLPMIRLKKSLTKLEFWSQEVVWQDGSCENISA